MFLCVISKLIIYKITLSLIYYFVLADAWSNYNFVTYNGFSLYSSSFSWLVFFISLPFALKIWKNESLEGNLCFALFLTYFIPALVFWEFNPNPWNYIFIEMVYFIIFVIAFFLISDLKIRPIRKNNSKIFYKGMIFFIAMVIVSCFFLTGSNFLFTLKDVYEIRSLQSTSKLPTLLQYLFSSCRISLTLFLGIALYRKSYLQASGILFLLFLAYSVDGLKSIAFITLLTCFGIFISFCNRHLLNGILGITIGGLLEFFIFGSYTVIDYLRRVLVVPAQLNRYYYDYFSQPDHPYDFFRQGFGGKLGFKTPYDMPITNMIGGEYYGKWEMSVNNGLISDAYYNLGWLGILLMPFLVVLLIKFFNICSVGLPKKILLGIIIAIPYLLITSSFFTLFFTHGVMMLLICLYCLHSFDKDNKSIDPLL